MPSLLSSGHALSVLALPGHGGGRARLRDASGGALTDVPIGACRVRHLQLRLSASRRACCPWTPRHRNTGARAIKFGYIFFLLLIVVDVAVVASQAI